MTTSQTEPATWLLGTYRVNGQERELHATPLRERGDVDQRHVDDRRSRSNRH